jgi:6-phosphogluconolactonase (cycloisomerase 2 family)
MLKSSQWVFASVLVLGVGVLDTAASDQGRVSLTQVASITSDELDAVVCVTISADGKFLYAAAWRTATVTVYARDPETGKLELRPSVCEPDLLAGTTSIALSPDGSYAVASAFRSRTLVLYRRDPQTGTLTRLDVARDGVNNVSFRWPIHAAFSPDSRFAYVLDDRGPKDGSRGAVMTFGVVDDKLKLVKVDEGQAGCYHGARGMAFHPDGKTLFVASYRAWTLVAADRDLQTGETHVRQVLGNDKGEARGLAGAFGVASSPDGRSVYVSAGRFGGDDAVSAFEITADGRMKFVQEIANGDGGLRNFEGGNHIAVSPDGRSVYASATRSGTVACFRRDPATSKLTYVETLHDGGGASELGAAGIDISPDGRFVYIATEDKKTLAVFKRDITR